MGEKLATLNLSTDSNQLQPQEPSQPQPPSADSVQVLLRQALRADDRVLLLDCLYNRDEKVGSGTFSFISLLVIPDWFSRKTKKNKLTLSLKDGVSIILIISFGAECHFLKTGYNELYLWVFFFNFLILVWFGFVNGWLVFLFAGYCEVSFVVESGWCAQAFAVSDINYSVEV